ncbi:GNAT family N-acetyltransferase [Maribacter aestuarii]|uniref:GNAT family N-acetyltransferase n=1 Tax=Maribacter aestuarii TaxID=1130723 RepID=UPI00248C14C4|nr:GNAT family N-acetyltransferase [Maribacter aestuarii]
MEIYYSIAATDEELKEILALQNRNMVTTISGEEREKEGFVTVMHSFDILKQMNSICPHIIAKANGKVVGYALSMHPNFGDDIPVLKPMFKELENLKIENYLVMGQVCLDKNYRKKGVFRELYATMKREYKNNYATIITEVDATNTRSFNAHLAVGFELLRSYKSIGRKWNIITLPTQE